MLGLVRWALALFIQISKIIAAKSVDGLAPASIYSDLIIYIVNAVYHIVMGSPFRFVGSYTVTQRCVCRLAPRSACEGRRWLR